ncbi:radical SAM protein [Salidesulfovibrio onnuriiensis]|uniref:radical SAM protein n=1 Tax=Salidesulfovibrio onnuriiensis TaxID=2583823 RepID=UPI00202AD321|nr:radical SAM protein [Salidesulfovibrio onnuriiensis]
MHLPVAPRANSRIRYGASGMKSRVLSPGEALAWLGRTLDGGADIGVVGITGPGDPFAAPELTLETLELVRGAHPDMPLCVTTNGLNVADHARALADLGLSHVTVEVHAVDPKVAENIYAWVRPGTRTIPLAQGVRELLNAQAGAITALRKAGLTVKVNTTIFKGINAAHVEEVAKVVSGLGADIMAVAPCCPFEGGEDAIPGSELMSTAMELAGRHMELMAAWEACGRDLVGTDIPESSCDLAFAQTGAPKPTAERPNIAVASSGGMDVDQHLGHAARLLVYGPREDGLPCLLGTRFAPEPGGGDARWKLLAERLSDCFALLVSSAGERPRKVLSDSGLSVLVTDCGVEGMVDALYGGGKRRKK